MKKASRTIKFISGITTALFLTLAGCAIDNPIDYTTDGGGVTTSEDTFAQSTLIIDNGSLETNNIFVNLEFNIVEDLPITHYYASESDVTPEIYGDDWEVYKPSANYSFDNDSKGHKTINVWFKNLDGFVLEKISNSIVQTAWDVDDYSVNIENGGTTTTKSTVSLSFDQTDNTSATHYFISESTLRPLPSDQGWENYSPNKNYTFSNNSSGTKTIHVWYKNSSNLVSQRMSAKITYFHCNILDDHGNNKQCATEVNNNSTTAGILHFNDRDYAGYARKDDPDYFMFRPNVSGKYLIYTTGNTDTIGRLEFPNGTWEVNKNSGPSLNFQFFKSLTAGETYYIYVFDEIGQNYSPKTTYAYNLVVKYTGP